MPKINVLEKHVAELIAAGEVVERPMSVVKELVENAIDAGASAVTVEIQHGGISFIRVADNGCGMAREDVPTAFLRHATSKILERDDLDAIGTLGFRGEALASICAVSRVEVLTCTRDSIVGTHYRIEGGDEVSCEDAGCPKGTTVIVRDLFYNTPARMKFLKKDVSEGIAVGGVMDKIALSHPEVSIRFLRDGKEVLHTPGDGRLKSAIFSVYGKSFVNGLLPVSYEMEGMKVWGFTGKPEETRASRSLQVFFVNGRFVKTKTAAAALEEAYKGSIMVGKFPVCVLHLEMPWQDVDVNVHPAKIEVRFVNERPIFDVVYHGVKTALLNAVRENNLTNYAKPAVDLSPPKGEEPVQMKLSACSPNSRQKPSEPEKREKAPFVKASSGTEAQALPDTSEGKGSGRSYFHSFQPELYEGQGKPLAMHDSGGINFWKGKEEQAEGESFPVAATGFEKDTVPKIPEPVFPAGEPAGVEPEKEEFSLRLIGELFQTYLLLQAPKEIILVDKHAAHERLLYERLKGQDREEFSQLLLEPVTVTLEKTEYAVALEKSDVLREAGFEIEDFGMGTILVRSAPLYLEHQEIGSSVVEILGYLLNHKRDVTTEHLDWIYHNIACRAAIKAGDHSNPEEMLSLIRQLYENPEVRYCPHGRPVFVSMTKYEIEKKFGRV